MKPAFPCGNKCIPSGAGQWSHSNCTQQERVHHRKVWANGPPAAGDGKGAVNDFLGELFRLTPAPYSVPSGRSPLRWQTAHGNLGLVAAPRRPALENRTGQALRQQQQRMVPRTACLPTWRRTAFGGMTRTESLPACTPQVGRGGAGGGGGGGGGMPVVVGGCAAAFACGQSCGASLHYAAVAGARQALPAPCWCCGCRRL
jgi:hypothetical protein